MSAENPDLEIAQAATLLPITEIAERAGIPAVALVPYGTNKAKVDVRKMEPTGRTGRRASRWGPTSVPERDEDAVSSRGP